MNQAPTKMEYRTLGKTGLKISVISYGNWLNADTPEAIERSCKCIKRAWDLGINFFDTAEIYGRGEAERQLGEALKRYNFPREDLVISTKIFFGTQQQKPNTAYLSRKHIIEGLKASLLRLQTSYVDVCFAHRPESNTPMEEICRAFDWCVRKGLCHYWGTSEWSANEIIEAYGVCDRLGLERPVAEQPQYNILARERFEAEYDRPFGQHRMGSTVWSPLAQGLLTGKYNDGIDQSGRLATFQDNPLIQRFANRFFGSEEVKQATLNKLRTLGTIANELGCTQAQLAMAWVIKNRDVSTAITGATREEQLDDIVGAIGVYPKITKEIENRIDTTFENKPVIGLDFKTGQLKKTRRDVWA